MNLVNALLADLHCTPCRNSQDEKQLKLILSLSQTSHIQHEITDIPKHLNKCITKNIIKL
jgi:hypothetical protein